MLSSVRLLSSTRAEGDQAEHVQAAVHAHTQARLKNGPQDDRRGQSEFNPVGYARREKIVQKTCNLEPARPRTAGSCSRVRAVALTGSNVIPQIGQLPGPTGRFCA